MCTLVSFVLTNDNEYFLQRSNCHQDIIKYFGLKNDHVVRVGLYSPINRDYFIAAENWEFRVDQKTYPDWTFEGDPSLEERARKSLQHIINEKKTGEFVQKLDYQSALVGDRGIVIAGKYGIATAGAFGFAKTSDFGISTAGFLGQAVSGYLGRAEAGILGIAIAGNKGIAISSMGGRSKTSDDGKSVAGDNGIAISGIGGDSRVGRYGSAIVKEYGYAESKEGGIAKAGENGTICIEYYNGRKRGGVMGVVRPGELEPNVFYKVDFGKFVKVD